MDWLVRQVRNFKIFKKYVYRKEMSVVRVLHTIFKCLESS